ncbi:MAG: response regulator [Alphaproteobacteria bacterium]|nr:response regulator [Alphaproteobacteria bacterium]
MFKTDQDIRPDKILEKRLLLLVFVLTATIVSIGFLFAYPAYLRPIILSVFIFIILSIYITITILKSGESAILYGGLANEILKDRKICYTILNTEGKTVLQNEAAREFLKKIPVLTFLQEHAVSDENNLQKLKQLQLSAEHFKEETLEIALKFDNKTVFSGQEWYRVTLRPVSISQTDNTQKISNFDLKYNTYLFWSLENITSEKTMDAIFQEERRAFYNFLNYLPLGLYLANDKGKVEYVNKTLSDILNTPKKDILGQEISSFLPKNATTEQKLPNGSTQYTTYVKNAAKEITEYLVKVDCFKEGNEVQTRGTVIGNIPTNAGLKQACEQAVSEVNTIFNLSPFGMMMLDLDLVIKRTNQRFLDILGVPSTSQLLNNYLTNYLDEESITKIKKQLASFKAENTKLQPAYFDLNLKEKNKTKILRLYICPLFSSTIQIKENIKGIVLFCLDTTEQKNLETQFAQAQKMQAMGQLAGGIAHDFNNLLTAMIGFCDLLQQRHSIGDSSYADIMQIKQNAICAAELVRQLLQFSRKQPLQPKLNDITDILITFTPLLKRTVGEQVELKFHHGENLDNIKVDSVQFLQVVLNLCVNAKDAMNKKGTLTISTQKETLLEPYHFGAEVIESGSFIRMDITDTGCGIPLENMSRIFEPFFSTKQNVVGSGTGLGLATVYGIVRQMEGFIKVKSTINVGTTFSIYLPAYPAQELSEETTKKNLQTLNDKRGRAVLTPTPAPLKTPENREEKLILGLSLNAADDLAKTPEDIDKTRILLVDDENSVRTFALRALRKKGYDVVGCNSAENALETLETDKNFQLLITDMVMPGQNGIELAKQVLEILPDIKIILASGYSEDILKGEYADIDNMSFIPKPFSLSDLTQKVYEVMTS